VTAADAHAHDDDGHDVEPVSQAPPPPAPPSGGMVSACPLCGAVVQATELRCPRCNMTLAGIDGRPGPFSRAVLVAWAVALFVIYLAVLAVVALFPA